MNMEYRINEIEKRLNRNDVVIERISDELDEIKQLISQIRYSITGGVFVFIVSEMGFFKALSIAMP
jgi:glutaredoxin 2